MSLLSWQLVFLILKIHLIDCRKLANKPIYVIILEMNLFTILIQLIAVLTHLNNIVIDLTG